MELRILPGNIANMIAAGEVVQRPASVVKELVENAVDAGAEQISVIIKDSGRTLIQVIDNGKGMNPDDAVLCFERHATSKIATAEDLEDITTFGFRGEALASIAAVAEVTLKTRTEDEEVGCQVEFAASVHNSTTEIATPKGTNIAVRNLFYNVPARRKFLKSDNVEFKHIVEEFTKVALTRPEIGFSLSHNGKDVFVLKPAKSLKYRIMDLLGASVTGDVVDVCADTSVVSLRGFVGRPDTARKTLGNQFFFVNGRYFRSPYLHKAVMKAYEGMIADGVTPSYFIYLEVDPHSVDVNISPTKSEVKFEDDSFIFQVVYASVKEVLGKNAFAGGIDFSNPEANDMPVLGSHFSEYQPESIPQVAVDGGYNPFDPVTSAGSATDEYGAVGRGASTGSATELGGPANEFGGPAGKGYGSATGWKDSGNERFGQYVDRREDYGKLFEEKTLPVTQTIILGGKYIVAPARDGLMIVNVRRARERILYDRALAALTKNEHVTQANMFPVKVEVGAANRAVFDEKAELLARLGFDISPFGTDTIVVNGVPEGYSCEAGKIQTMVSDLLLILSDDSSSLPGVMEAAMAEKIALLGASSCDPLASPMEARHLLDTLLSSSNPELTGNGKRIMAIMTSAQVEKLF
ncbi:MAG: DNA mismatch repair endonuclease MutL [Bacteroidales bacterium]|uniref:DNA mismatch repair endonuclease MutL n=1 Tax=Candidatus Cryptobacteroides bacterium TaxID=3085639 RepID=UPI002ECECC6F|nr:DNA mismatch repair endonuclease MutL [Bacteroidales bacterium]